MVRNGEVFHRPELVPTARMSRLWMGDELQDDINSRCVDAQGAKITGDMTRSAAQIKHRAWLARQVSSDEGQVLGVDLLA
jgi:hypothetical protein